MTPRRMYVPVLGPAPRTERGDPYAPALSCSLCGRTYVLVGDRVRPAHLVMVSYGGEPPWWICADLDSCRETIERRLRINDSVVRDLGSPPGIEP